MCRIFLKSGTVVEEKMAEVPDFSKKNVNGDEIYEKMSGSIKYFYKPDGIYG